MKQCNMRTGPERSVAPYVYASGVKGKRSGLICLLRLNFHSKDVLSQTAKRNPEHTQWK